MGLHLGCLGHCCNRHVHSKISEHQDSKPALPSARLCITTYASLACAAPMHLPLTYVPAPCQILRLPHANSSCLVLFKHDFATCDAHSISMLFRFGQSHCCLVARSPADVVLQTEDASDRLRDIIAPMAGGLSSALTPLKGMVR